MRQKIKLGMTLILLMGIVILSRKLSQVVTSEIERVDKQIIVIDPGHGGNDPGKVGVNGALEKDINLQIGNKVKQKLEEQGFSVVMTREDDEITEGKLADMKRRVALIEEINPIFVVSIHQNSYTDASVRGAQVFYYTESEEGKEAAEIMQQELWEMNPNDTRNVKANSDFYLLKKTSVPTIIVECGFLSNPEEAESLLLNEYQEEMSMAICTGIIKYLD